MSVASAKRLSLTTAIALGVSACGAPQRPAISSKPAAVAAQEQPTPAASLEAGTGGPELGVGPQGDGKHADHQAVDRRDPKAWIDRKKTYATDTDGFPQIIQGDAYPTIAAIAAWYEAISGSST